MKTLILASLLALTAASGVVVTLQSAEARTVCRKVSNDQIMCAVYPDPPVRPNQGDMRVNMGRGIGWVFR